MHTLRTTLLRTAYRLGHPLAHAYWRLAQPTKRGVKCVLTRGDEVLLVRHTYGSSTRWELPGGGVKRREEPRAAARREAREELGVDIADWRPLGDLFERIDGKRVTRLQINKFPKGTHTLRIVAQHSSGKKTISTRKYRGCNKGAPTTIVRA